MTGLVRDTLLPNVPPFMCRNCHNAREEAWKYRGLCRECGNPGFLDFDTPANLSYEYPRDGVAPATMGGPAPLDLMPPPRGVRPPANSVPHTRLDFVGTFANPAG